MLGDADDDLEVYIYALSKGLEKAPRPVGNRRGPGLVLKILAGEMEKAGYQFYWSDNGVWLTDHVPVEYIQVPPEKKFDGL
jgi:putative RNA 2'-phosphotransferase